MILTEASRSAFKPWRLPPPSQGSLSIKTQSHLAACAFHVRRQVCEWACMYCPFGSELNDIGCMWGFSLIVLREMMCEVPFQHSYLGCCPLISSAISRTSWCTCILGTWTCNCPDGISDGWSACPQGCLWRLCLHEEHFVLPWGKKKHTRASVNVPYYKGITQFFFFFAEWAKLQLQSL